MQVAISRTSATPMFFRLATAIIYILCSTLLVGCRVKHKEFNTTVATRKAQASVGTKEVAEYWKREADAMTLFAASSWGVYMKEVKRTQLQERFSAPEASKYTGFYYMGWMYHPKCVTCVPPASVCPWQGFDPSGDTGSQVASPPTPAPILPTVGAFNGYTFAFVNGCYSADANAVAVLNATFSNPQAVVIGWDWWVLANTADRAAYVFFSTCSSPPPGNTVNIAVRDVKDDLLRNWAVTQGQMLANPLNARCGMPPVTQYGRPRLVFLKGESLNLPL